MIPSDRQAVGVAVATLRLATAADVAAIEWLDQFGDSPHRDINHHLELYFGSVDPSLHERHVIVLAEVSPTATPALPFTVVGKAELLLAPLGAGSDVGYIKRVVIHPAWRGQRLARRLLDHIRALAPEFGARHLDLHVGEDNAAAIALYESLGFAARHREIYMRLSLDDAAPASPTPARIEPT